MKIDQWLVGLSLCYGRSGSILASTTFYGNAFAFHAWDKFKVLLVSENTNYTIIRHKSGLLGYANACYLQQDCELPEVSFVRNSRINGARLVARSVRRGTSKNVSCIKTGEKEDK